MRILVCLSLMVASLAAQPVAHLETAPPDRWDVKSLTDIRQHLSRERGGLLVILTSNVQETEGALRDLLAEEALWPLSLRSLVLDPSKGMGLELQAQHQPPQKCPRWAFMGPNGDWVAEGPGLPLAQDVTRAFQASGCRTRLEVLETFLSGHPEQLNAVLESLREMKRVGDVRTRKSLGNIQRPDPQGEVSLRVGSMILSGEKEERFAESHALLQDDADQAIWEGYRKLLATRLSELLPLSSRIAFPLARLIPECLWASPLLQACAQEVLPDVERELAARPSDKGLWDLWIALHASDERDAFADLLGGLTPSPLEPPGAWPPPSIRTAYLNDCRAHRRWKSLVEMAEPAWRRLQEAAQEEKARFSKMGYLSAGIWEDLCDPLLEGLLRLNRISEADDLLKEWLRLSNWRGAATRAQMIAMECDQDALLENWSKLLSED